MTPHHRRAAALAATALAGAASLAALAPGAPSDAAARPTPAATGVGVVVPQLAPVLVDTSGSVPVPVRNRGTGPLSLSVTVTLDGVSGAATTATVPAGGRVVVTPELAAASLGGPGALATRLSAPATVRVSATAAGRTRTVARPVTLVPASTTTADPADPGNPLAGRPWASYSGTLEPTTAPYARATGDDRDTLAPVALLPKARWFTSHLTPSRLGDAVRRYVAGATAEDPDALVQLTMFVLRPWEGAACDRLPTAAELRHDRAAITAFVGAIGDAHAAVVVQPDGPFAGCAPGGSPVLSDLVASAVHRLAQLPNTAAYVDMGSADWHRGDTSKEVPLLLAENVAEARGFAMDVTHTDAVEDEVRHADLLIRQLAAHGVPGKHAVIDTSDNGRPFDGAAWRVHHPRTAPWAAPACQGPGDTLCVALGIPPTTDVADPAWGLAPDAARMAARDVDAYLWIKRPWLDPFAGYRFSLPRALAEVAASPYA